MVEERAEEGLVIVFTGDGKGKTSASLGVCLRALIRGMRVFMVQFIKGSWKSAEVELSKIFPNFRIVPAGLGFVGPSNVESSKEAARKAWEMTKEEIQKGEYDLYVLDELNYAVGMGFISQDEVVGLLRERPQGKHIVITGRGRFEAIEEAADLVTEMKKIKHPFDRGIKAVEGIDF